MGSLPDERDRSGGEPAGVVDLGGRKERVLHTRVPDSLDRHIKRRARSLGTSVSTVVRNVLLSTFGLVEDIVHDSTAIALAVSGQAAVPLHPRDRVRVTPGSAGPRGVLAWQEAVLNVNAVCDECNAILAKGRRAAIGIGAPGPRSVICPKCLGKLASRPDGPRKSR